MTIKEYWNLIGREPFLAITWKPDFSQESSFYRMFKDHKNFRLTPIPEKINDLITLKTVKNLFWPFLTIFEFIFLQKKSCSVTYN